MKAAGKTMEPDCQTDDCLARSVVDTLAHEPGLEAITIDAAHEKISVATLGRAPEGGIETLTRRVSEKIHGALESRVCGLLEGAAECNACEMPLSPGERRNVIIRRDGGSTTISRATCPTAPSFWRWRDLPLPRVVPRTVELPENAEQADAHINEWKGQMVAAIFCGVFALAGALAHGPFKIAFYAAAYVAGSFHQIEEIWERLREKAIDVHFLMIAVAVGAACIGAWAQGAILLFLFSLSGALEHFALGRTQKEIRSLFRDAPKFATVIDRLGGERETRVEELRAGMRILVKPGAQFPVDGEVAKGATAADESNLTGESTPVEKTKGQTVLAGTLNLWGAVEMIAARPAAESAQQRIIKLIREAQQQKAPSQRFTDKFSARYTYFALGLSVVMFFVWWLGFHLPAFSDAAGGRSAFYRTMTLLVVSSPCALVLSIPSAILAAIAFGARHGILFRGGAAVEKLADVRTVALDKTGTLTTGELRVETVETFPVGREKELARLAYSIEKLSTHPLARAITLHGKQQGLDALPLARFESITGEGLRAHWNGNNVFLGRRGWILDLNGSQAAMPVAAETHEGVSEVWIACGDLLGRILLRDDIRPQAGEVVQELRREQLRTVVLTGDRKSSAENLKARLGLDDVRAELKPEDKVAAIRDLSARDRVAMVGDGVNDAPSLAAAHIGVAMGARGADAALEQADVVLMHDRLENFLSAYRLSRRARAIIRWNLFISLGTVAVLVTLAMFGEIPLTAGVVGHEGSTVVVVMNSLRLLFGGNNRCKPRP